MRRHALDVFDGAVCVGSLGYEPLEAALAFTYDPHWLELPESYAISPHIPMLGQPATSSTVRRFLDNLLPEGRALDIASATHQVSKNDVYGLICELGQETAGALAFVPRNALPMCSSASQREISREELRHRISERAHIPWMAGNGRRMSIAEHQDELPVHLGHGRLYLADGERASTHRLKPESSDARLPMLAANEHFSMCLARRLGLLVAPASILRLPDPVLLVERFDRVYEAGRVRRLHVIDACQALDLPVSYKYERNVGSGSNVRQIRDGASFPRLFSMVEYTVQKAATRLALLRWALFNYLIGNCDAHGKNVSFFCRHTGLWLAPFFDLVSIAPYDRLDHELAMAYGDGFLLEEITPFQWASFAHSIGIPRTLLAREMRRMSKAALAAAPLQASEAVYVGEEKAFVAKISAFVQEQATKLAEMAMPMTKSVTRFP